MKFLTLILSGALGIVLYPSESLAQCEIGGSVISVELVDAANGTPHIVRLKTGALSDFYYEAETDDNNVISGAMAALTSQAQVTLVTDDFACPSVSSVGPQALGRITLIDLN